MLSEYLILRHRLFCVFYFLELAGMFAHTDKKDLEEVESSYTLNSGCKSLVLRAMENMAAFNFYYW